MKADPSGLSPNSSVRTLPPFRLRFLKTGSLILGIRVVSTILITFVSTGFDAEKPTHVRSSFFVIRSAGLVVPAIMSVTALNVNNADASAKLPLSVMDVISQGTNALFLQNMTTMRTQPIACTPSVLYRPGKASACPNSSSIPLILW